MNQIINSKYSSQVSLALILFTAIQPKHPAISPKHPTLITSLIIQIFNPIPLTTKKIFTRHNRRRDTERGDGDKRDEESRRIVDAQIEAT